MGERLQHTRLGVGVLALAVGLALAGCGASQGDDASSPASSPSASAITPSTPSGDGASSASASADPTAGGDWWPEQQKTMVTGQEFPADYEPATLDHPARNVPKPVMPEEARQETEAGAQAFLNYRTDAVWYAFQTGDTSLARDITSNLCEKCNSQFQRIEEIYSSTGWLAGGYEKANILSGGFIQGTNGIYEIPVSLKSSGVKATDGEILRSQQHPFVTDEGFNANLDYKDGAWLYITASPRSS